MLMFIGMFIIKFNSSIILIMTFLQQQQPIQFNKFNLLDWEIY